MSWQIAVAMTIALIGMGMVGTIALTKSEKLKKRLLIGLLVFIVAIWVFRPALG